MPLPQTMYDAIKLQADLRPDSIAVMAPGYEPLSYQRLVEQIEKTVCRLNELGIGRNDRVGLLAPNGPQLATAFICVACEATAAPLNPAFSLPELESYVSILVLKGLLIGENMDTPARSLAQSGGLPILEIVPQSAAGSFWLRDDPAPALENGDLADADDLALIMPTSGTTSRPKIVPLTHRNITASIHNHVTALGLDCEDRCLNVMPLFHIHALVSALLASLASGGSVVCTPGYQAEDFFGWLEAFRPTWYTASPTIHQAVLEAAREKPEILSKHRLRFIRSAAAPLPLRVRADLERIFGVPVIESYGMTEAAAQITSNPLPPGVRLPGSVGTAAGPQVAIQDENGHMLPPGERGEIVIRGENVMAGYENDPEANRSAFAGGWFKTGDMGHLNEDGYLFITGRIKEIIIRGGEKIVPREVEEALLEHPTVKQAVAFGVPHQTLGEDVLAAVILKTGAAATAQEIRAFTISRLADFKVPSQILVVDAIPRGPTGKPQRRLLAEQLIQSLAQPFEAPQNEVQARLIAIWSDILGIERIGVQDNYFALGGDSIKAFKISARIEVEFGLDLSPSFVFEYPTLFEQAQKIEAFISAERET